MLLITTRSNKLAYIKYAIVIEEPSYYSPTIFILKTLFCTKKPTNLKRRRIENGIKNHINRDISYVCSIIVSGKQLEKMKLQIINDIINN
jgi:hypothetical protein